MGTSRPTPGTPAASRRHRGSGSVAQQLRPGGRLIGHLRERRSYSDLRWASLWQNGVPTNLGNLGGAMVNLGQSINDLGEVVACADLASELPGFPFVQIHAFLWNQAAGMQDIGTVGTDFTSFPFGIN